MVETRRVKATRLALDLAKHRTETQAKHSSLIRLPVEIRLMIYKEVWTPTVMPWKYDEKALCSGKPVRDHMKQIHVLTSVCRHMRYEVIAEYFHRSQAHVTYCVGGFGYGSDVRVLAAMRYIKTSSLFAEHVQHVRLNWLPDNTMRSWLYWGCGMPGKKKSNRGLFPIESEQPGRRLRQVNTLKWLASLKSLQTLEIAFMDVLGDEEDPVYFGHDPLAWRALLKLPKLEGISFRLCTVHHRKELTKNWEDSERFRWYKEVFDEHLLKDSIAEKKRKPCRIDVNVGMVRVEDPPSQAV